MGGRGRDQSSVSRISLEFPTRIKRRLSTKHFPLQNGATQKWATRDVILNHRGDKRGGKKRGKRRTHPCTGGKHHVAGQCPELTGTARMDRILRGTRVKVHENQRVRGRDHLGRGPGGRGSQIGIMYSPNRGLRGPEGGHALARPEQEFVKGGKKGLHLNHSVVFRGVCRPSHTIRKGPKTAAF